MEIQWSGTEGALSEHKHAAVAMTNRQGKINKKKYTLWQDKQVR